MRGNAPDPHHQPVPPSWLPVATTRYAPPAPLKAQLHAELATATPASRRAVVRRQWTLAMATCGVTLVIYLLTGGVNRFDRSISLVSGTSFGMGLIAVITAWMTFARGRPILVRPSRQFMMYLAGSLVLMLAWKIFWSAQYLGAFEESSTRPGLRCLALSLSLGLSPLVGFAYAHRKSDPVRPVFRGFAAGVAIGGVTSVLTDLWCPVGYVPHVLLGHFLPIVVLGGLGAWLGSEIIALRGGGLERNR